MRRAAFNVDLRVQFVNANGGARRCSRCARSNSTPATIDLSKLISLRQHTTRRHYAGEHAVEVIVNGAAHPGGSFVVIA